MRTREKFQLIHLLVHYSTRLRIVSDGKLLSSGILFLLLQFLNDATFPLLPVLSPTTEQINIVFNLAFVSCSQADQDNIKIFDISSIYYKRFYIKVYYIKQFYYCTT
jgi:hypothetical protein